ncbi:MAG TPA: FdhF/YdeP family oxidoreductase [Pyrinomonadaceae bacterium]|jgi:molybdopterin-dependent oxidoreductase alpha subunit|nr:FdhF/YdeP family oxidoreductase [Pyrinomonadaceae bacterium]
MTEKAVSGRAPEKLESLRVTKPLRIAAGMKAIWETMANAYGKMGFLRGTRTLLKLNQKNGIDCQSCAWSDPEGHRTIAEFCESGAKALADEGMTARIGAEFFRSHSVEELAEQTDHWLNAQGRLTHPVVLRKDSTHYEEIAWEDAFTLIAEELNALGSPDEAIFYTSGRTSNEAAFLYQLFVRQFGTNNMPDCSNMCHESSSVGLTESIGLGKATIGLEDFKKTDLVIVIGQNPGTNAPRMMSSLQDAKYAGAKMIAINPLPEAGLMNFVNPNPQHYENPLGFPVDVLGNIPTKFADLHLPLRIGGDMAVLKGIMKTMLEREREKPGTVFDQEFIAEYTTGHEEFLASLDAVSWDDILSESGLERAQIEKAAQMFIEAERVITCWAMGITQHKHAVATIQDIANMHFLRGQIGKEGAGLCPVRGHSNVQGDRTMGIWEKMNDKFRANLEQEFDFKTPEKDGFHTVEAIGAMNDGRAKIFIAMGGNFVSATPDTDLVAEGLRKCKLTVQVLTKFNRTALVTGEQSLVLPCLGRSEIDMQSEGAQFVSTESTMLQVQMSKGILKPASKCLRSEPWIVAQMAKAVLGENTTVDWEAMAADYDKIRDSISRVVFGCENYNERIRKKGGFYLPNPPRKREFHTESGKAEFRSQQLEKIELAKGRLLMTTIRAHNQFNTTIYDLSDRYRGIHGERRVILLNPKDMRELGLEKGQVVNLTSHFEDGERHAPRFIAVPYPIPRNCAATYFPEANPLIPVGSFAAKSFTPTSKCTVISIQPTEEIAGDFAYDHMGDQAKAVST